MIIQLIEIKDFKINNKKQMIYLKKQMMKNVNQKKRKINYKI